MIRFARFWHRLVGAAAVVLAAGHMLAIVSTGHAAPWLWAVGLAVLVPGAAMLATARRPSGAALASALALLLAAGYQLAVFEASFPALFAGAAAVDLALLAAAAAEARRPLLCALAALVFLGGAGLVAVAVDAAGDIEA
jgi:hypothetical protein